ncbi:MAG: GntR family transcriptional regulator [Planctomycetota bacterium]|nr:GntR family transcriptional regulator [Planctomycetota bacterium]
MPASGARAYKPRFAQTAKLTLKLVRDDPGAAPLVEQLREGIRREIVEGRLKPGQALLPQRQLCKQLNLNQVTVTRALQDLVKDGLLRSEHGRGLFVNDLAPPRLAILCRNARTPTDYKSDYGQVVHAALERLARQNVAIEWFTRTPGHPASRFGPELERVLAADCHAYLTVGIQNEEYFAALVASGKPVVALDASPTTADFDGIVHDSFREGYLATRHLLEHGHRGILYLGHDRGAHPGDPSGKTRIPEPDSIRREAGYRYALMEAGVARREAWTCHTPSAYPEAEAGVRELLAGDEITAAVCWGHWAEFLAAEIKVPHQCSVVCFGEPQGRRAWTHCTVDLKDLSRATAQRVLRRLRREDGDKHARGVLVTVPPILVGGATVRRVGPAPAVYEYHRIHGRPGEA